jgi:hypothetical protein
MAVELTDRMLQTARRRGLMWMPLTVRALPGGSLSHGFCEGDSAGVCVAVEHVRVACEGVRCVTLVTLRGPVELVRAEGEGGLFVLPPELPQYVPHERVDGLGRRAEYMAELLGGEQPALFAFEVLRVLAEAAEPEGRNVAASTFLGVLRAERASHRPTSPHTVLESVDGEEALQVGRAAPLATITAAPTRAIIARR